MSKQDSGQWIKDFGLARLFRCSRLMGILAAEDRLAVPDPYVKLVTDQAYKYADGMLASREDWQELITEGGS